MLDGILSTYVLGVVSTLMSALTPLALTSMTLWVMVFGWAVVRGEVAEAIPAFLWKAFKIGLVLAFGLQSGFYISNVADTANGLAMGVASTFLPSGVDPATVTTAYALLDKFNDQASAQVADIMKEASIVRLDLVLAAIVFSFGSVIFLCIALFIVTLSKVLLTFVIAIGPLFILCLAWRPTQRFFDSWLSMVLNTVVLTWFAFFALGLSNYAGMEIFKAIHDGGGFLGGAFNVLGEATRYCILMLLMAIICFQAPALTSALTGGVAVQQGVQLIQNAMTISGMRSTSSGRTSGRNSDRVSGMGAGGQGRTGAGNPNLAGQTAGMTAGGGQRVARQALSATRTAAYKLAALRGRA